MSGDNRGRYAFTLEDKQAMMRVEDLRGSHNWFACVVCKWERPYGAALCMPSEINREARIGCERCDAITLHKFTSTR